MPDIVFSILGIEERVINLDEVTVTARRRTREQDIYINRSTSVAYYDVQSEFDDIYDSGKYTGNDIHELMKNLNDSFRADNEIEENAKEIYLFRTEEIKESTPFYFDGGGDQKPKSVALINVADPNEPIIFIEYPKYKGKLALFVINHEPVDWTEFEYFKYKNIRTAAIKSIYINEDKNVIAQYIKDLNSLTIAATLIETYPEGEVPVEGAKGVRKTFLEGYSAVKEFYSPNYTELPPVPDYRRTLYWNPSVAPDENGIAKIQFYNNSSCRNFSISAETVTPLGMIGVLK